MGLVDNVSYLVATKIIEVGIVIDSDNTYYAAGTVERTYDNYLSRDQFKMGDLLYVGSGENYYGDLIPAPTIAEVLDWFRENEVEVAINLETIDYPGWTWSINCFGNRWWKMVDKGKAPTAVCEETFDDFDNCANLAIQAALEKWEESELIDTIK